jgi:formylglycine-generating enzyme required for sulfatase activity
MDISVPAWQRVSKLLEAPDNARFTDLVKITGLNKKTAFRYNVLRGINLEGQNLADYDFTKADLSDAKLKRADFSKARGLETANLKGAEWDHTTRWPLPSWGSASGRDNYGPWVDFTVQAGNGTSSTQRLRWIRDGEFDIGSPESELGRLNYEGPQKRIRFADGFWLFDTPCTQALWSSVMDGDRPSFFQSPNRPVETVGLGDIRLFIRKLNQMKPGIDLSLPSESRWEYACRAGTEGAIYARDLAAIAWFDGNSSAGFELNDYKRGTHPVGEKQPNDWGLYDMLGNVWEWCVDKWHDSHQKTPVDGAAYVSRIPKTGVLRGGAWCSPAVAVRAAYRLSGILTGKYDDLGFRCARSSSNSI